MGQTIEKEKLVLIPPQIKPKRRVPLFRSDVRCLKPSCPVGEKEMVLSLELCRFTPFHNLFYAEIQLLKPIASTFLVIHRNRASQSHPTLFSLTFLAALSMNLCPTFSPMETLYRHDRINLCFLPRCSLSYLQASSHSFLRSGQFILEAKSSCRCS